MPKQTVDHFMRSQFCSARVLTRMNLRDRTRNAIEQAALFRETTLLPSHAHTIARAHNFKERPRGKTHEREVHTYTRRESDRTLVVRFR